MSLNKRITERFSPSNVKFSLKNNNFVAKMFKTTALMSSNDCNIYDKISDELLATTENRI